MWSKLKTRIIATVGPACATQATLRKMIQEGASVFRFNFSHGTFAEHERILERIRKVRRGGGHKVEILQDLAGHRIRTGRLSGGKPVLLKAGEPFTLLRQLPRGTARRVSMDYPGAFTRIGRGEMIYISDGSIHLRVLRSALDRLDTLIEQGGVLGERKGVNIPGIPLVFPHISDKDIRDLEFALKYRVDYVAQSFVRSAADVLAVKNRLASIPGCKVIAKIEDREGIRNIAAILKAADGIMVARGDLGISVPIYEIPVLQKWLIAACNHVHKPVITATQMLENMSAQRSPTRAEVNDVANAVIDGSDFVMLSGETATGKYPVETVRMMRKIIQYTLRHAPFQIIRRRAGKPPL